MFDTINLNILEEVKSLTQNKMNILNKIFSRKTFRHCLDNGYDKVYGQVVKRYANEGTGKLNSELISEIYNVLKTDYRNEYYYKNTLLNKLLLGVHSINTTTALTEISVAKSKADFVLINGKAVVYEIKTELDNLERLESQINDYYKAFDHVAVVTYKENVPVLQKKIEIMGKPVGIYILQKRGTITTVQKPTEYKKDLDPEILFKILRKPEYEEILLNKYKFLPQVSEFMYYSECKKLFLEISLDDIYLEVLRILKKRTQILKEEFDKVPYELKFLAYFMNLKSNDYEKLKQFLNKSFGGV